ncbi:uncharacterized protein V1510DRAFT_415580 [Dipodascopsis tothii]|uniref:uncharacterized protein n=1 Tax=Dipodascopsis tothii TaxID=44089 RepID=UPI0034D007F3
MDAMHESLDTDASSQMQTGQRDSSVDQSNFYRVGMEDNMNQPSVSMDSVQSKPDSETEQYALNEEWHDTKRSKHEDEMPDYTNRDRQGRPSQAYYDADTYSVDHDSADYYYETGSHDGTDPSNSVYEATVYPDSSFTQPPSPVDVAADNRVSAQTHFERNAGSDSQQLAPSRPREKQNDRQYNRPFDKLHDRQYDRQRERQHDRLYDRPHDRPNDRQHERQHERSHDRPYLHDRPHDRSYERQYDRHDRLMDRQQERPSDRRYDRSDDKGDKPDMRFEQDADSRYSQSSAKTTPIDAELWRNPKKPHRVVHAMHLLIQEAAIEYIHKVVATKTREEIHRLITDRNRATVKESLALYCNDTGVLQRAKLKLFDTLPQEQQDYLVDVSPESDHIRNRLSDFHAVLKSLGDAIDEIYYKHHESKNRASEKVSEVPELVIFACETWYKQRDNYLRNRALNGTPSLGHQENARRAPYHKVSNMVNRSPYNPRQPKQPSRMHPYMRRGSGADSNNIMRHGSSYGYGHHSNYGAPAAGTVPMNSPAGLNQGPRRGMSYRGSMDTSYGSQGGYNSSATGMNRGNGAAGVSGAHTPIGGLRRAPANGPQRRGPSNSNQGNIPPF